MAGANAETTSGDQRGVPASFAAKATALFVLVAPWSLNRAYAPLLPPPFGSKIQLADLVFLVALATSWREVRGAIRQVPPVALGAGVAFVALSFVSALVSASRGQALVDAVGSGYCLATTVLVAAHAREAAARRWLLAGVAVGVLVVAVFGVVGLVHAWAVEHTTFLVKRYGRFGYVGAFYRPYSLLQNPKLIASYFGLALPLLWWTARSDPSRRLRWIAVGGAAVTVLLLPSTATRGAGVLALAAYLTWAVLGRSALAGRMLRLVLVASVLVTVALVVLSELMFLRPEAEVRRIPWDDEIAHFATTGTRQFAFPEEDGRARELRLRATVVRTAYTIQRRLLVELAEEHPWLGVGPGTFRGEMARRVQAGDLPASLEPIDPHHTVLGLLAERGALGAGAFLGFWVALWLALRKAGRARGGGEATTVAVLACIGLASLLLEGLLYMDVTKLRPLWVHAGIALGAIAGAQASTRRSASTSE